MIIYGALDSLGARIFWNQTGAFTCFRNFQLAVVLASACFLAPVRSPCQTNSELTNGFSRIIPGWTNYSTAFNATHDLGTDGDFATVATFYPPPVDVRPVEYGVIVVWAGSGGQRLNFANFDFRVFIWGSVEAFRANPREGDLATFAFPASTGGSITVPDTLTRGGRPAYHLCFSLTNSSLTLTQCHSYLVGFAARTRVQQDGELFVPTAPHEGPSDVTAGSLVPLGFMYLLNAGGYTLYSGQLAADLLVEPQGTPPTLLLQRVGDTIQLRWSAAACCYTLEAADDLGPTATWTPILDAPLEGEGDFTLMLPATSTTRYFRLNNNVQEE